MITHTKTIKEHFASGALKYECTMAFLSKASEHLYPCRITGDKGTFIRINHATKFFENGEIQWRLIYNDNGEVIGSHKGSSVLL